MTQHIGRKQQIGIGKETTSGTPVSPVRWIPKVQGSFAPKFGVAKNEASYGVIDGLRQQQTVKTLTEVVLNSIIGDSSFGDMLMAALGTSHSCVKFPIPGSITGTFVEGETITQSVSGATGVLRRADVGGSSKALYISVTSGTFASGNTLTGGTSGATTTGGTIESPSAVRNHVFRRLNTNNHPAYTFYGKDDIGDERAAYCMLDSLEIEVVVGDFAKFTANFLGQKIESASAQVPLYAAENDFLAKHAVFKSAAAFSGLDAASPVAIERFKIMIQKNVIDYQAFGDTDVASLHNQRFDVKGDLTLLYDATTFRDYVTASTKQAMRLTLQNSDVTIGSAAKPLLQFDMPKVSFEEWSKTQENDTLVKQTLAFVAEYDVTRAMTCEALLQNTQVTAY